MEGQDWQFAGSAKKDEPFEINGVDVWSQGWQVLAGEEAHVNDPVYGKGYIFRVFSIQDNDQRIEFAAGEFSSGVWGFYTRE
jgi:hypothetical protein